MNELKIVVVYLIIGLMYMLKTKKKRVNDIYRKIMKYQIVEEYRYNNSQIQRIIDSDNIACALFYPFFMVRNAIRYVNKELTSNDTF